MRVWRDGAAVSLSPSDVVLDDVFELTAGDQIAVDAEVVDTTGMSVDESLLTGEADAVGRAAGENLLSGSFVVAGGGSARATAVGDDAYAARLAAEARQFRRPRSELARGIDRILQVITWLIVPVALVLFLANWVGEQESWRESLVGSVAGVVALVPQGLVLLLSMAQAVAVIRLGRDNVLVQQLQAVETLARVTVLATDKTGTLTTGAVSLVEVRPATPPPRRERHVDDVLASVAAVDDHPNATMAAIAAAFPSAPGWTVDGHIPFDSAHKYTAVAFEGQGAWYIGAPEVLVDAASETLRDISTFADEGMRVLLLAGATIARVAGRGSPRHRAGGNRGAGRRRPSRREGHDRVLPARERAAQGHLWRQPAHGGGHRRAVRRARRSSMGGRAVAGGRRIDCRCDDRGRRCSAASRRT